MVQANSRLKKLRTKIKGRKQKAREAWNEFAASFSDMELERVAAGYPEAVRNFEFRYQQTEKELVEKYGSFGKVFCFLTDEEIDYLKSIGYKFTADGEMIPEQIRDFKQ